MVASVGAVPLHASLSIYDLSLAPDDAGICTFLLPQVRDQSSLLTTEINISGDQSCLWTPSSSLKVPFFTSHKNKVLGITYTSEGESHPVSFVLFVSVSTILKHIHAIRTGESDCDIIPWDEWGVCGARFHDPGYTPSPTWVRCAYGQEYVLGDSYLSRGCERVRMYDFNSLSLKRALSSTDGSERNGIITDTTRIEAGVFAFPVLSSLPCQVRTVLLPSRGNGDFLSVYNAIMLTEDALVAVSVRQSSWFKRNPLFAADTRSFSELGHSFARSLFDPTAVQRYFHQRNFCLPGHFLSF